MSERGELAARVAMLERELAQLRGRVGNLLDRPAQAGDRRNPRLCVTAVDPEDASYPAEANGTVCFWVKFVDATFTESVGPQSVTNASRQVDARFKALGPWVPAGSQCWALFDHGRWWLSQAKPTMAPCTPVVELACEAQAFEGLAGESRAKIEFELHGYQASEYCWVIENGAAKVPRDGIYLVAFSISTQSRPASVFEPSGTQHAVEILVGDSDEDISGVSIGPVAWRRPMNIPSVDMTDVENFENLACTGFVRAVAGQYILVALHNTDGSAQDFNVAYGRVLILQLVDCGLDCQDPDEGGGDECACDEEPAEQIIIPLDGFDPECCPELNDSFTLDLQPPDEEECCVTYIGNLPACTVPQPVDQFYLRACYDDELDQTTINAGFLHEGSVSLYGGWSGEFAGKLDCSDLAAYWDELEFDGGLLFDCEATPPE